MRRLWNLILGRAHTCPRWLCFTFDNPIRRWLHEPARIVGPHVRKGDRVLDLGPGRGVFTLPLAERVGPTGMVYAADVQPAMLETIDRRAARRGLGNIRTVQIAGRLDIDERFDFVLMFWMLHEVDDRASLLRALRARLTDGAVILLVEPIGHVRKRAFDRELELAREAGLDPVARPRIAVSHAALLRPRDPAGSMDGS